MLDLLKTASVIATSTVLAKLDYSNCNSLVVNIDTIEMDCLGVFCDYIAHAVIITRVRIVGKLEDPDLKPILTLSTNFGGVTQQRQGQARADRILEHLSDGDSHRGFSLLNHCKPLLCYVLAPET